ncbi:GNAT family N-acetyltransferase [Flavobacterium sp. RHBU_24]|uniref:GNAT family N-acetyltransferase n=1 Tax=Flavobacterium sp. RHBU_24 TaxID=3391185 RepID=UPI00398563D0
MHIRKASQQDFEAIYHIAVITWNATYSNILSPEQMQYMLELMYSAGAINEQIAIKGHHFIIAEDDEGRAVAFASYEVNHIRETTKVHKLYVLPDNHGRGVGRALISVIENAARHSVNDKLLLNVNRYNPAVNFYLKTGFINMGIEDVDIGAGYLMEDYKMVKQI